MFIDRNGGNYIARTHLCDNACERVASGHALRSLRSGLSAAGRQGGEATGQQHSRAAGRQGSRKAG